MSSTGTWFGAVSTTFCTYTFPFLDFRIANSRRSNLATNPLGSSFNNDLHNLTPWLPFVPSGSSQAFLMSVKSIGACNRPLILPVAL